MRCNVRVCENYPRSTCILNCEFCLAFMPGDATDGTGKVIAVQRFDVLDLERIQIQIIHPKQRKSILYRIRKMSGTRYNRRQRRDPHPRRSLEHMP